MSEYDFYESAAVRMLDRCRFPLPWYVEEAPSCFVVRCRNSHAIAHVYYGDKPSTKLPMREEARRIAVKVATLPARIITPPQDRPN
jgi:hypothetical protein